MIAVQRPVEVEQGPRNGGQPEPERIVLPSRSEALVLKRQRERDLEVKKREDRLMRMRAQVRLPERVRLPASFSRKPFFSARIISIGLTLSCIVFLLAASIIAFVLIGRHKTDATALVRVTPGSVRVGDTFTLMGSGFTPGDVMTFTYDTHEPILNEAEQPASPISIHINRLGGFSIQIPVSNRWSVGTHTIDALDTTAGMDASTQLIILASSSAPPALQLVQSRLQFPDAAAGVVSSQFVVLTNAGGSKLAWHGQSDQPWLMLAPNNGAFAGAERVQVTVNRGSLVARTYTGHILFEQQDGRVAPSVLTVQMVVKPSQAALAISTTALTYVARSPRSPADQFIVLRNDSKNALNWTSSVAINEGVPWIELTPAYGQLRPGERKAVAVGIQSQSLVPGLYQGVINFTGGADAQVRVDLKVLAAERTATGQPAAGSAGGISQPLPPPGPAGVTPTVLPMKPAQVPVINLSTTALHFATTQGQNPSAQNVTLVNAGNATLTWSTTMSGSSTFAVTPTHGSLAAGASTPLTISADVGNSDPGTLAATIAISGGASLPGQKIMVDVTINSAQPALSVAPNAISCSNAGESQQLSITNNGTETGHWALQHASASTDTSWLSFSLGSGELAPGESATITVHCDDSGLDTGTYTATLDVSDSDEGAVIKAVPVTFAVS